MRRGISTSVCGPDPQTLPTALTERRLLQRIRRAKRRSSLQKEAVPCDLTFSPAGNQSA